MKSLKDTFNAVVRAGQRVVHEMPIKVYSSIFAVGDLSLLAGGIDAKNPVWIASAATFMSMNVMKVCFGTGGTWDETLPAPTLSSAGSFLAEMCMNPCKLFSSEYRGEMKNACRAIEWNSVKDRLQNAWKIKENPFYAGLLGYGVGGTGLMIDGLNLFSYRPEIPWERIFTSDLSGGLELALASNMADSGVRLLMGASAGAASVVTFLTNRNDLAGPAFAASSLCVAAVALANPSAPGAVEALCAFPLYVFGDFLIGRVKPENQSLTHGQ